MSELRLRADLVAWQKRIRRPVRRLWAIMLGSCGFAGTGHNRMAAMGGMSKTAEETVHRIYGTKIGMKET